MIRALALCLAALAASPIAAQDRTTLGWGRLFVNDALGDSRDRWQTGAYAISVIRGPDWNGRVGGGFGEVLEFRFRGSIIAPENLANPGRDDRRYAGTLSAGLHTHFALGAAEVRVGADLVVLGPQTGLGRFQRSIHDALDLPQPDLTNQIGDSLRPTLSAEIGRSFPLGDGVTAHPFVEAQAGVETLLRAGVDVTFGRFGQGALMTRDVVTGFRYAAVRGDHGQGFSAILGADVARVFDSAYFPDAGLEPEDLRTRVRAGINWQGQRAEVFYGVTWLSEEFKGQPGGQLLGALRVNWQF
jgi:hypothetical protein